MATVKTPNISQTQIETELDQAIKAADPVRLESLQKLQRLRSVKTKTQQREFVRLSAKLGDSHPRVIALQARIDTSTQLKRNLKVESMRAQTVTPQVESDNWLVHGRVLNTQLEAVSGVKVALYDRSACPIETCGSEVTDRTGYFNLMLKRAVKTTRGVDELQTNAVGKAQASITTNATVNDNARNETNTASSDGFLYVLDKNNVILHRDKRPLAIGPGQTQYLEIVLDDAELEQPVPSTRYLGNSATRELHDLKSQKPACKIDEIRVDHRINFKTQKEALALGYDYCAYCFGKDKSKR